MSVKVSVIVPVYKAEKYLHRCIDSLLAQTINGLEIILIDDGSPDSSGRICDEYTKKILGGGHSVKVIHKENGGISSARNTGLDVAMGEYIAFSDDDDIVPSVDVYERLYEKAISSGADFVQAGCEIEKNSGRFISALPVKGQKDIFCAKKDFLKWLAKERSKSDSGHVLNNVWNKLYKKSFLNRIKFDTSLPYTEDAMFNLSVFERADNVLLTPFIIYKHFYIEGSGSRGEEKRRMVEERTLNLIEAVQDFYYRNSLLRYNWKKD